MVKVEFVDSMDGVLNGEEVVFVSYADVLRHVVQPTEVRHSQAIQITKIRSVSIRNPNVRYNKEEYDCVTCRELRKSKYENQGWEKGERGRKLR